MSSSFFVQSVEPGKRVIAFGAEGRGFESRHLSLFRYENRIVLKI